MQAETLQRSRIAPLARTARARPVRPVLGIARVAGHLRGNGARRLAQAAGHCSRAGRHRAAALRPLADGRFPKTGTPLAQRPRPRETPGLVNFGLCPFLYWQNKMPEQPFFNAAVFVLVLSALLFLFNLNVVLKQLGAMLPDETLRHETRAVHRAQPLAARRAFVSRHGLRRSPAIPALAIGARRLCPTGWIISAFGR